MTYRSQSEDIDFYAHFYVDNNLNSTAPNTSTSASYVVQLPSNFKGKQFKIDYISIPKTWYNVTATNNIVSFSTDDITYNNVGVDVSRAGTVTVPKQYYGNYSLTGSGTQNILNIINSNITALIGANQVVFAYDIPTGKVTITNSTAGNVFFKFAATNSGNTLLGFTATKATIPVSTTANGPTYGDFVANITNNMDTIFLVSNTLTSFNTEVFVNNYTTNYLSEIPTANVPWGSYVLFNPQGVFDYKHGIKSNYVDIMFLDRAGNQVNLNGGAFTIKFIFLKHMLPIHD